MTIHDTLQGRFGTGARLCAPTGMGMHHRALNTLLNELCGYLSTHGDIVEAEALDILARAEKRSRSGPRLTGSAFVD